MDLFRWFAKWFITKNYFTMPTDYEIKERKKPGVLNSYIGSSSLELVQIQAETISFFPSLQLKNVFLKWLCSTTNDGLLVQLFEDTKHDYCVLVHCCFILFFVCHLTHTSFVCQSFPLVAYIIGASISSNAANP